MKKILIVFLILLIIVAGQEYIFNDSGLLYDLINYEESLEKIKIAFNDLIDDFINEEDYEEYEDFTEDSLEEDPEFTGDIKIIREKFYEALLNGESEFTYKPKNLTVAEAENLNLQSIIYESPDVDLGYRGVNFEYSYIDPYIKELRFNIDYFQEVGQDGKNYGSRLSQGDLLLKREKLDKKVEEFLNNHINSFMTDLEKEIAIHDYIVKNAEYNHRALSDKVVSVDNYNAYGILVNGSGVCDGYAKAFYTLGKAADLEVKYVAGTARNEAGILGHAWNLINLEGDWYAVDTTWNDPVFVNGNKPKDFVSYEFFNLTDEMISHSHFRNPEYDHYPKARGTKYGRDALMEQNIIRSSSKNRLSKELLAGILINN